MAKQQFELSLEVNETLFVEEIWPDGDAPENPTVEDVKKVLSKVKFLEDIGIYLSCKDLEVRDVTKMADRLEQLILKAKDLDP